MSHQIYHYGPHELCDACQDKAERRAYRGPAPYEIHPRGEETDACEQCGAYHCEQCDAFVSGSDAETFTLVDDADRLCFDCAHGAGLLVPDDEGAVA
jgi:hypothetical protein